jgi:hypothetical protein
MREISRSWFHDQGVPWDGANGIAYGGNDSVRTPLVADDDEVSIIAARAACMAIDLLAGGGGFPQLMYVLAFKKGWMLQFLFQARFNQTCRLIREYDTVRIIHR